MFGLRFEPIPGRTTPDVKGVFWLDAETGTLDRLELAYVNVGVWQRERGAAGELDFEQLPDGRWFVSSWWIRMPVVRRGAGMQGPVWQFQEAVVGFKHEGGEVTRVFAPDGRTLYARERATVAGIVFDSTTGEGLADAFVRLANTTQVTISQVDGSYWLTDLPDGDYTVTFTHPRAELLGLTDTPDREDVDLERGTVSHVDLALPSSATIIGRVCGEAATATDGLLVGRVRDVVADSVVEGARVRVIWLEEGLLGADPTWREVITDAAGIYRLCVPKGLPLSVEVTATGLPLVAVPITFGDSDIHELDVELGN